MATTQNLPIMDAAGKIIGYEARKIPKKRAPRPAASSATPKKAPKSGVGRRPSATPSAAAPVPVQIVKKPTRRLPAPGAQESRKPTAEARKRKEEREAHRATFVGRTEAMFDAHRGVVRGLTIVGVAVGAVKLNQQYPDGLTPLKLEASTCVALGTTAGALIAKHFGYKRVASGMVDLTLGAVTGTLAADVQRGKTPLIAS